MQGRESTALGTNALIDLNQLEEKCSEADAELSGAKLPSFPCCCLLKSIRKLYLRALGQTPSSFLVVSY
jgi:hypothetical protein